MTVHEYSMQNEYEYCKSEQLGVKILCMDLHSLTVRMVQTARIRPRRHCAADSRAIYQMQMNKWNIQENAWMSLLKHYVLWCYSFIVPLRPYKEPPLYMHVLSAILAMTSGRNEVNVLNTQYYSTVFSFL